MNNQFIHRLKKKYPNQRGMSLLLLIFIMTALAGVGAAIYTFTTSATFTELTENNRNRAYQMAWAGMNYAAEQYAAGTDLDSNQFKNRTYTLANNRGAITYNVALAGGQYNVTAIGTVNGTDGLLLARAQVGSRANQFPAGPANNEEVMTTTFLNLSAFEPGSLKDSANRTKIRIGEYVATGGLHLYWAAFTDLGTYPVPDADNPGCNIGFHVGKLHENFVQQLRQVWNQYNYVDYDQQSKAGWYKGLNAAVSGLNMRWHEVPAGSGKYEGYGLSFMRYTYSAAGCGAGYDYIPNSIKPPGQAGKLLLGTLGTTCGIRSGTAAVAGLLRAGDPGYLAQSPHRARSQSRGGPGQRGRAVERQRQSGGPGPGKIHLRPAGQRHPRFLRGRLPLLCGCGQFGLPGYQPETHAPPMDKPGSLPALAFQPVQCLHLRVGQHPEFLVAGRLPHQRPQLL